jgi:hypothetical protein
MINWPFGSVRWRPGSLGGTEQIYFRNVRSVLRVFSVLLAQGRAEQENVRNVLSILSAGLGARIAGYSLGDAYVRGSARHQRRHQAGRVTGRTLYVR